MIKELEGSEPKKISDSHENSLNVSKSINLRSPEEEEMLELVNKNDKVKKDKIDAIALTNAATSGFVKLLRWNNPKILILIGGIFACFNGFL